MAERGIVSVDGEGYVPLRDLEALQEERDRFVAEVERLRAALRESTQGDERASTP
jgi:hypothetical protein